MKPNSFLIQSPLRGKARDAFRVMGDMVAGLPAGKMPNDE